MTISGLQKSAMWIIAGILIVTVLEFPPPLGFESRPQDNVSIFWLFFFLIILISEISAIPLIFKKPNLGAKLAIFTAIVNILQVIADQTHMMQPEVAPLGYLILEDLVFVLSLVLGFVSFKILNLLNNRILP